MATRDYSSINSIKDFAINELAPKYFNMDMVNDLNLGLLGYTTELIGSVSEDSFNTITTYLNEIFPHLAVIPENIFNYGALFQIDGSFATASQCNMTLFIPESVVLESATKVANTTDLFEFFIDSDMTISIEDIRYKPDYDIKINYKRYRNDIIFTAMYDMREYGATYKNSISNINSPYIKLKRINYERTKYLMLEISTHQVDRFDMNDNIVDSTIINLPRYVIEYDDFIANFEIFYKKPNTNYYVQMEKKLLGSSPSKEPFCYYKAVDEGKIEISFTSRDNYFHPEYNSEINISYFTTIGLDGNFEEYTGTSITVTPSSETYDYNNNLTLFALPITGSYNGSNPLSLEQLKSKVVEMFSTVGSYTNENDLQLYFNNFNMTFNSNILFLKKRDDIFERIFSAFLLMKDTSGEIYSTNTLQMLLNLENFDSSFPQSDAYLLEPGHLFRYKPGIIDTVELIPGKTIQDFNESDYNDFIYSNPFLIYFTKNPIGASYYLTTIDNKHIVDYSSVNTSSLVQFICNNLTISRDGISGSNKYKIRVTMTPTTELDNPMVIEETNQDGTKNHIITDTIKVRLIATDEEREICYLDMELESWDLDLDVYTFSCEIETDDFVMINNKFRVLNMTDSLTDLKDGSHIIPMTNSIFKIRTSYRYAESGSIPEYTVVTNEYTTETDPITFIKPMHMVRSTSEYISNNDGIIDDVTETMTGGTYSIRINSAPFVRASIMADQEKSKELYNIYRRQYNYIENSLELITNNYAIDLKFYNTYGKSKNFYLQDINNQLLDKVNISIKFKIHPAFGTVEEDLIRDVKIFIKEYIENLNDSGTNTFYVSNLIRRLENNFSDIEYLKFSGINDYDTDVQAIINTTVDLNTLSKNDRILYVPEYLTLNLDDIHIEIF